MKKQILTMFTGLFIGAIITGGASAYAAGILAEHSNHRIFVDGQEVQMEAYAINGNNYVKLRDIGEQVGFNVYWDSDTKCVQVESEKPYTGEAPEKSAEVKPMEHPSQTDVATAKQDIIDRTNALRKENCVAVLRVNNKLMQAAQVRADEMAAHKPSFTNDDSLRRMLYLASQRIVKHWHARCQNWDLVLSQLESMFADRAVG